MLALSRLILTVPVFALLAISPDVATAAPPDCSDPNSTHPKCGGGSEEPPVEPPLTPTSYKWMHNDVGSAFDPATDSLGGGSITGVGSHLVILDNFSSNSLYGNLDGRDQTLTHGEWTSLQSRLVAPGATFENVKQPSGRKDRSGVISDHYSADAGLQVVNLSFGLFDPVGTDFDNPNYSLGYSIWDSLVKEAHNPNGEAVFVKAAGNLGNGATVVEGTLQIGFPFPEPHVDALNISLIGAENALFVGALDISGTIASYSTVAGDGAASQYLVVRVDTANMGENSQLSGTSFAAPIVTGYAALIGQKFSTASPDQIVDQLLETAISGFQGYSASVHGQGEASLANALSPITPPS